MMSLNWTLFDLWKVAGDRTAERGRLDVQDDLQPVIDLFAELPYAKLVRRARVLGIEVHDYRQRVRTGRGKARGTRGIADITALWWHQMAAAIDDPERCLGIPAHGAVIRDGSIVLLHPIRAYMFHGHAANRFSIGIEMAIRAAGIEGDARTFWRSRKDKGAGRTYAQLVAELTDTQAAAGRLLGEYYVLETARQAMLEGEDGGGITHSGDHRFSHRSRVSDPGSKAHKALTAWVARDHELIVGPVVGSGKRNPEAWSGKPGARYNWRVRG